MSKGILVVLLFLICFIYKSKRAYAVITTINSYPQSISNEPFTVDVTITGAVTGTNYLRIDLYKTDTTNYFGETFNSKDWYGENDYLQYLPITIQSGIPWSGQIQARVGNPSETQYETTSQYKLKIRRYTSSGSYNAIETNTSAVDVNINIIPTPTLFPTETPAITELPTPTQETALQSYNNVYISEAMVFPSKDENEWVEIYNDNDFVVYLNGWFIDDIEEGGSVPKSIDFSIEPKSFAIFEQSNAMFNNSGDSIRLLDFNKTFIDGFEYGSAVQGKTFGRRGFDSDEFCLQEPSRNAANNPCINPTETPVPTTKQSPTFKPTPIPSPTQLLMTPSTSGPRKKTLNTAFIKTPMNRFIGVTTKKTSESTDSGNVLGIETDDASHNKALIKSLSIISFSYSLLTIIGILLKMKVG